VGPHEHRLARLRAIPPEGAPAAAHVYLAERNIAVFSTDIDSRDFKLHKPEEVIKSVMGQLEKHGKGIILMHDFHRNTAEALPELIRQVVHMVPKGEVTTVPKVRRNGQATGQAFA
jgi:hypothetical protein